MSNYSLQLEKVTKIFGRRLIFKEVTKEYNTPGIYGITGANGTGKSTLVKIIAGVLSHSKGQVIHSKEDKPLNPENIHNHIGFAAPYLTLYEEFTAEENIKLLSKIRGLEFDNQFSDELFKKVNLFDRKDDTVKAYSSGMKQRLRLIFALIHNPELVILDEPTSNLDEAGKEICYDLIRSHAATKIFLLASNEAADLALCAEILQLSQYKVK